MEANPLSSESSTPRLPEKECKPGVAFANTSALLRYLYADLSRISSISAESIILHAADRALTYPPKPAIRGRAAVQAHEEALIAATGGTLLMDVESITANEHFGTVLGMLRAKVANSEESLAVPFCGVWRFQGGQAVEHWENASNVEEFMHYAVKNESAMKAGVRVSNISSAL